MSKNKSYSKDDIARFKSDINLVSVMKHFGFANTRKSTRNAPQLQCKKTGEVFNVSYKNKYYTYWSFNAPVMSGKPLPTIIDFLMSREAYALGKNHENDFYSALQWCDKALNDKDFLITDSNKIDPGKSSVIFNRIINSLDVCSDFSFFENRGIDKETIKDPRFFKCFGQYEFRPEGMQQKHINTVSLLKDRNGKNQSIAVLNLFDKPKFNPSGNAMFYSVPQNKDKRKAAVCENLHILESSLDAVSKYELNKSNYADDIFFSCEGAPSSYHAEFLSDYVKTGAANKICFGTDKDPAGEMFACHFALNLNITDHLCKTDNEFSLKFENAKFEIISGSAGILSKDHIKNRRIAFCKFVVKGKNLENNVEMGDMFVKHFEKFNNLDKFVHNDPDHKFNVVFKEVSDNLLSVNVSFCHSFLHWQQMNNFVHEFKFFNSKFLQRDLPVLKDYNDDLKAVKGLHKKFSIVKNEDNENLLINKENNSFWKVSKCDYNIIKKQKLDDKKIKQARSKLQM